jgi:Na+/H+ antiporter NhaD/arsenite permease-like protein
MLWISISVFLAAYALMVTEKMNRTVAAMLGAAAVLLLHAVPYEAALEYVDLDVVFLLVGMMVAVDILSQTGLFEWVAIFIAQRSKGNPVVILIGLLAATALLSAFLDNVTTVVLIAPITILIAQILELPVAPFLILEALFSNIGGTATLVGDPPNILIGSKANLSFNDFIVNLSPIVVLCTLVVFAGILLLLHGSLKTTRALRRRIMKAEPAKAILDPWRLKRGLAVFFLILGGFVSSRWLDLQPGIIAIAGAFIMILATRSDMRRAMEKVEWETILFLVGLFMLVGSLEHNGLFDNIAAFMFGHNQGRLFVTAMIVLWTSAILSAFFGNIPVVIAMIPLVHTLIASTAAELSLDPSSELMNAYVSYPMWWSLALGACLGGNGTLFGAAANVVVIQVARRNGYKLSFWDFMRYGAPVTVVTLIVSSIYIYVRYFAFSPL